MNDNIYHEGKRNKYIYLKRSIDFALLSLSEQNHHLIQFIYNKVRFVATQGPFWDGPRNFEPRSDDEDDTELAPPLQTSGPHQLEDFWRRGKWRVPVPLTRQFFDGSGFEPGNLQPRGRNLNTRSPRPQQDHKNQNSQDILF
ncbi:hypothetical protein AVEN_56085-1 [Araneus ventricosus]|uniref:Uncharacterized protein n=1 Tax=Araneus ventricosus TaxID=182803 RepID=A0A4Y2T0M4_ARAVE|nr:hypothetical protein AVEN_56085-1 [Araneus ventricosus]